MTPGAPRRPSRALEPGGLHRPSRAPRRRRPRTSTPLGSLPGRPVSRPSQPHGTRAASSFFAATARRSPILYSYPRRVVAVTPACSRPLRSAAPTSSAPTASMTGPSPLPTRPFSTDRLASSTCPIASSPRSHRSAANSRAAQSSDFHPRSSTRASSSASHSTGCTLLPSPRRSRSCSLAIAPGFSTWALPSDTASSAQPA